jgi:hypothetical protein
VLVFDKVPMFYFLLHAPLIHLIAVVVCYARYGGEHWMFESRSVNFPSHARRDGDFLCRLFTCRGVCVVIALYPFCHWFASVKQRRGDAWLSYF